MSSTDGNENWVLGVTLGLLGSIAINTGNNIQSLGLKQSQLNDKVAPIELADDLASPDGRPKKQSVPWLSPKGNKTAPYENEDEFSVVTVAQQRPSLSMTYVIGTIIFVSGSLLNFASYAFAAQSMLASLESVQFVTNLLFGKFMLGAHVNQTMLAGTFLTVGGTVMAVQFSSKETLDLDTEDIKKLYANPAYLCYLFIIALMLVILHFVYQKLDDRKKKDKPIKRSDVIMPCVYSIWSALFGTQSVVQAKVLAELLAVHSNGSENIFASWFTYATMLLWIMTVLVWLKRLNDALERFNPLFIIPLLQCSFIFFAIVSGGIFFKEFNAFDTNQWVGFWFGIVVMFSGLILLTPQPIDQSDDDQLHRDLMNLILEQRGSSSALQNNSEHNPDSEVTPRTRTSSKDETKSTKEKSPTRSPRFSKENMTKTAIDVVREVVSDSALLFQGAPSTRVYSDAMMAVKNNTDERRRRRVLLETLLEKIRETPISSNGWSNDIATLIQDLNLTEVVSISPPGPDRDIKTHLTMTQEKLKSVVEHEIQQSITPREISYHEIT
ncbi:hypothetical protein ACHAWO_001680 [Cyclotella atomus]|uniref:Magnesium transporter n=1 Tax=Cyclotella atomus TaxID=382360 RepID=A0ABD3Q128_9STRA